MQGASDLTMNVAGAVGGALAGLIVAVASYGLLCAVALLPVPVTNTNKSSGTLPSM